MEFIIVIALIGLIPAAIARSKGHSFFVFWIYGAMLFIVALPHALLLKKNQKAIEMEALSSGLKKCPFCAEMIKNEAVVCRFCGNSLPAGNKNAPAVSGGVVIRE